MFLLFVNAKLLLLKLYLIQSHSSFAQVPTQCINNGSFNFLKTPLVLVNPLLAVIKQSQHQSL